MKACRRPVKLTTGAGLMRMAKFVMWLHVHTAFVSSSVGTAKHPSVDQEPPLFHINIYGH